jgi:hypothetical protein
MGQLQHLLRIVTLVACATLMVALTVAPSPARAESATSIMTEFGLVGTWSPDCSLPPGKGMRTSFVVPPNGPPMRHTIATGDRFHFGATTDAEIVAAVHIAQDRLRIIQRFTKVVSVTGAPVTDYPKGDFETLIQKQGDELSIIISSNGRWQHPIPVVYNKCSPVDNVAS